MGLDNIPAKYPCKTQGTAVLEVKRDKEGKAFTEEDGSEVVVIDCKATQEAGGCPYANAYAKSGLTGGSVLGMFGTDCWYRGKYGNALLEEIGYGDSFSFFGDNEDGTEKSPESCRQVALVIQEAFDEAVIPEGLDEDLKYAAWYLDWAADECGGLVCWY